MCFFIHSSNSRKLYQRIQERFEATMYSGLLQVSHNKIVHSSAVTCAWKEQHNFQAFALLN
jgi:tRNA A37 N6-isopentenylltransferase MiaA